MKLLYFYDALCGWCYGFSPTIQKFAESHEGELTVEVISGGMVLGERVGPIGEVAPYIASAYKVVEEKTGVRFGDKFLNEVLKEGSAIFSSLPPAIALTAFKSLMPDKQLIYAAGLQKLIYFDGTPTEATDEYVKLAAKLGANPMEMKRLMEDQSTLSKTEQDFHYSQQLGVTGFPTTVLDYEDKLYALGRGAIPLADLEANFQSVLSSEHSSR